MSTAALVLRRLPAKTSEKLFYRFLCGKPTKFDGMKEKVHLRFAKELELNIIRGDVIGDSIYFTGAYEPFTTKALLTLAKQDGGLFVDVGANLGYYTCLWSHARPSNRCIAIEASPRNIELLKDTLTQNSLEDRCVLLEVAATNQAGELTFDQGPVRQTGWGGISEGISSGSRTISVPGARLDELIQRDRQVRLLKIDVEGAEGLVLEGAEGLLKAQAIDEIWFEDNVQRREMLGISESQLFEPLKRNGYEIERSSSDNPLAMDYVATPQR